MIGKTSIIQNLNSLERLYNNTTRTKITLFYSKLSILELCGWIEMSMDNIVQMPANRKLKARRDKDYVKNAIIKRVHSFDYHNHFRSMLMQTIGFITLIKIEKRVNQLKLSRMQAALRTLKSLRDNEAHTYIKGTITHIDAPSVTKAKFFHVYDGLKMFEDEIKLL